jgi:hypothetical protein
MSQEAHLSPFTLALSTGAGAGHDTSCRPPGRRAAPICAAQRNNAVTVVGVGESITLAAERRFAWSARAGTARYDQGWDVNWHVAFPTCGVRRISITANSHYCHKTGEPGSNNRCSGNNPPPWACRARNSPTRYDKRHSTTTRPLAEAWPGDDVCPISGARHFSPRLTIAVRDRSVSQVGKTGAADLILTADAQGGGQP